MPIDAFKSLFFSRLGDITSGPLPGAERTRKGGALRPPGIYVLYLPKYHRVSIIASSGRLGTAFDWLSDY